MSKDIQKEHLYQSVKTLLELDHPHLQLVQPKLFTLFSIAFQYLLYRSTKDCGIYFIRIEDSFLAQKLTRRAKDESSRRFMEKLLLPRKLKYGQSHFFLDFFPVGTWSITKDLPKEKIRAALIVKDTSAPPVNDLELHPEEHELPQHYYINTLMEFVPKTITVAFGEEIPRLIPVKFPFIRDKAEEERPSKGVRIASHIDLENIKE